MLLDSPPFNNKYTNMMINFTKLVRNRFTQTKNAILFKVNRDVEAATQDSFKTNNNNGAISNSVITISTVVDEKQVDKKSKAKVGSSHYVPTLYWNELSPAWSNHSTALRFLESGNIESKKSRWAFPVA